MARSLLSGSFMPLAALTCLPDVLRNPGLRRRMLLDRGQCVVGRGASADLWVPDEAVSREHLVIREEAGGYVLEDLGSRNGTRLNGRGVTRAVLSDGDEICVGQGVVMHFHLLAHAELAPTPFFIDAAGQIVSGGTEGSADETGVAPEPQAVEGAHSALVQSADVPG